MSTSNFALWWPMCRAGAAKGPLPSNFGAPVEEWRAFDEGAALWVRDDLTVLLLSGPDRVDFLHRICSQDIKNLALQRAAPALFLTNKGKYQALAQVLALEDRLLLLTATDAASVVLEILERYHITEDLIFQRATPQPVLVTLAGPDADACCGRAEIAAARDDGDHALVTVGDQGVISIAFHLGTAPAVTLLVEPEQAGALVETLIQSGAVPVGADAAQARRIVLGLPWHGCELDDGVLPQEAELERSAVSFTKGCYVGQETVARLKLRGHTTRRLCRLRLDSEVAPERGAPLLVEGAQVGALSSVTPRSLWEVSPWALGFVKRDHAAVNAVVRIPVDSAEALATIAPLDEEPREG